jgi:8-oxo-dGTP pyrophosphatase MutT (NUDIX family)
MTENHEETAPIRQRASRQVHKTPWLGVREDTVEFADGRQSPYTVIECGHCVGVLPLTDDGNVLMVRQYRYIAGRYTWEMPTGGVRLGEPYEQAAQRELAEEAGHHARELLHVSTYHTSKSSIDETAHLYIGRGLTPASAAQDDDEDVEYTPIPFAQVLQMVLSGEITDSMTIIAVLHAVRMGLA